MIRYVEIIMNIIYRKLIQRNKSIETGKHLHIKHRPIIDVRNESKLIIGNNVTLNSKNEKYHVSMFAPVKLFSRIAESTIIIGENTRIHGSCINAHKLISIGKNCLIAANCQIFDYSGHDINKKNRLEVSGSAKEIIIGDYVWLGTGSIILPGTVIHKGSVVAAGSVVRGSFKENSLIAGNPAKLIKYIDTQ